MPMYMDRHEGAILTPEEVADAHRQDVAIQDKYGVRYLTYWLEPEEGSVFCLAEAPSAEAAEAVHRDAHGNIANRIIEVDPMLVRSFLGRIREPEIGEAWNVSAFRTILFTDIVDSTALTQRLGDEASMRLLRRHDDIVRASLRANGGDEVKHTGDGIMASFRSATDALRCAREIQERFSAPAGDGDDFQIRIGINAGEPVTENGDLFGAAVQLAAPRLLGMLARRHSRPGGCSRSRGRQGLHVRRARQRGAQGLRRARSAVRARALIAQPSRRPSVRGSPTTTSRSPG